MIFITSDTHRELDIHKINPDEFTIGNSLTKDDYLIITGDFGCLWDGDSGDRFWLNWLETLPWNTLFIDGNHENFDVIHQYPIEDWHGGKVRRIRSNIFYLMRGEQYDIDGSSFFCFGGGFSHDREYRQEGYNWWEEELPTKDEVNHALDTLNQHDWKVDYVLTHDIYKSHPYTLRHEWDMSAYSDHHEDIHDVLEMIENKLDYKCWFHGHYHTDSLFHSSKNKPCVTLFDQVICLDSLEDILQNPQNYKISPNPIENKELSTKM